MAPTDEDDLEGRITEPSPPRSTLPWLAERATDPNSGYVPELDIV